ncbi:hypothetical protein DLAC_10512 [Tieghemostelium lacteum]|uniref:AB hydrolase-1 domain-containing protein n=1 Tax=Tieghemostelium lacteum TaxID=361077 RepID=A0A151Z4P2_TIELA|nr:hypothetical protein DLAC_10512 [Tieghemostelium lacteum]|eukprot:KYQ88930.1 hypothetical protein DLAC_10512 [Tieghemostelium lacteum]
MSILNERKSIILNNTKVPHKISYIVWYSEKIKKTICAVEYFFCVHRLTGNARDFDRLAAALINDSHNRIVICPDMAGRGDSDYLEDPKDYNYFTYIYDVGEIIRTTLGCTSPQFNYLGTSMGGLIGIMLFSTDEFKDRVRNFILNDISPKVPKAPLQLIADYLGKDERFKDKQDAIEYFKRIHSGFGILSNDKYWSELTDNCTTYDPNTCEFRLHYDPKIGFNFSEIKEVDLMEYYKLIKCNILILRGKNSEILPKDIYDEVLSYPTPKAIGVEFDNVGHAPSLVVDDQLETILKFIKN